MVPDVSYNCKLQLQPHQGALRCLLSTRLLLFLNRKTEKPKPRGRHVGIPRSSLARSLAFERGRCDRIQLVRSS
jgi:hypothetical protein